MANQEHLDILKQGVDAWNKWREEHSDIQPDLNRADLSQANLVRANFRRANFYEANLSEAFLSEANLGEARLSGANLSEAKLNRADLSEAKLNGADLVAAEFNRANLSGADLSGADLDAADLSEAVLSGANLGKACLSRANLSKAFLNGADLSEANLCEAFLNGADLSEANLCEALLCGASLININLRKARLNKANLHKADLFGAYLSWTDFSDANLSNTTLFGAYLREANLSRANLREANLSRANFFWPDIRASIDYSTGNRAGTGWRSLPMDSVVSWVKSFKAPPGANLRLADLSRANLGAADLSRANLSGANLQGANLSWANLSGANLSKADITGCFVYATSAWDVLLEETIQANLIITAPTGLKEASITVDNLEVAQFIYLLLNNKKIRDVLDTITSKVVLILGRFTPKRKAILDALKNELRKKNYIPVLFDFKKPASRDITETISTLAYMARFVIADLTDARSIPQELMTIVPNLPSVAIQPLILNSQHEYGMFEHFKRFPWVLPLYRYTDETSLLQSLSEAVIIPAEQKVKELAKR